MARQHQRFDSDKTIECRVNGRAFSALLCNISLSGCMIETPLNRVSYGDRLFMKIEGSIRLAGLAIWREGHLAGIRFDELLHDAVVRYLGYNPVQAIPNLALDRFGRSLPRLPRCTPAWARF
ncbi:PilZ domain-containing protein [Croceicoccus mobilis]|uniref:PilZ domain-containing protein n=1 Tax=Croceicoccus mobilis TaxID=1703339 RepID=UPI0009ED9519